MLFRHYLDTGCPKAHHQKLWDCCDLYGRSTRTYNIQCLNIAVNTLVSELLICQSWSPLPAVVRKTWCVRRMRQNSRSGPCLTCSGLARNVLLGCAFQAHQGSQEILWTSLGPLADWSQTQSKYFNPRVVTEHCLKGAEGKPVPVAVVWAAVNKEL